MTDDSARPAAPRARARLPRVTVRVMTEGAGPMDLKDSPARLVAALYEGHEPSLDVSARRSVARAAHGTIVFDRGGAARYKWRARVSAASCR